MKIYVHSLGCPKNTVDTERLLGALGPGLEPAETPERADLVLINTCAFIAPAVEESLDAVVDAGRRLAGLAKRPPLAVAGCLVSRYGERELARALPEVDLWLSTRELDQWPGRVARLLDGPVADWGARLLSTGPSFAWLKVSEGCAKRCSFCTIPSIRGKPRSVAPRDLEQEARRLLETGIKELVLVGQDVAAYGRDLGPGNGLEALLERLLPLDGLARLRLMYLYPAGLTPGLLRFLERAGPPFAPYFDVPLQHAHPDILRNMGRPFAHDPEQVLDRVRSHFPDAALRTSLITGFPGERPHHFKALLRFVERARFHHLGVFPYWPEEGTRAAGLPGRVGRAAKERRRDEVMALQAGISRDILAGYVGQELDVLVDRPHPEWPGLHTGRAWFQAPEVDGVVYISGPGVAPGSMVRARMEESGDYDLTALV